MSGSNRRLVDLDYAILHRTGRKVPKIRGSKMANRELEMQVVNINSDIEDLSESFEINDLTDEVELSDYVAKIGEIKREFRRIHAQLKVTEKENFEKNYPDFQNRLNELNENFKNANGKLNTLKKAEKQKAQEIENLRTNMEAEKLMNELEVIRMKTKEKKLQSTSERNFFVDQIKLELADCDWSKFTPFEEIRIMMSSFEARLENFYKICSDLEGALGTGKYVQDFKDENDDLIVSIRRKINDGKIIIVQLNEENELLIKDKFEKEANEKELIERERKEKEETKINNLMICAKNLHFEIKLRYDTFLGKCAIDVSKLSDYEILDLKKREDNLHIELRELMDKISSFVKFVLPCGEVAAELCKQVLEMRTNSTEKMDYILKNVGVAITERDISEKKLKNSAGLNIVLSKFKGYYSDIDIYTFRSEFNKLIEPNVQKGLWADYLKKNYLAGAAYNLVSKIENIDEIWKKLIEVYGDTQILFQNKISSLEKFSNLEKLKDDEKISYTITSMLNVMSDLEKLAEDYDLEGELYHGGGLQRIMGLMGNDRERKFIKLISKEKLKNKQKWCKLVVFLQNERKERDAFILNEKEKKCMNLDTKHKSDNLRESKKPSSKEGKGVDSGSKNYMSQNDHSSENMKSENYVTQNDHTVDKCVCPICGKTGDHVLSVGAGGKPYIEYVACKTFVDEKPRERDKLLYKKRFCSKCLKPGVKYNADHVCIKKYACNQTYINKKGKESKCEKHVIVCGYHANEKNNKDLLELYKKNVIKVHGKFRDFTKEITISCFAETYANDIQDTNHEDSSIFAFQTINIEGLMLNLFYDSGCGDLVVTKKCADKLKEMGRANQEFPGPIVLNGVGDQQTICEHGVYSVILPLESGSQAKMSGCCVDSITVPFPKYPLKKVEENIHEIIGQLDFEILPNLPKLPNEVGGEVDVMIGKQYLKYFPKEIVRLESGLTLYKSLFRNPDGSNGVISGPHSEFTKTDRLANFIHDKRYTFVNLHVQRYNKLFASINEVPLLGNKELYDFDENLVELFPGNSFTGSNFKNSSLMQTFLGNVRNKCELGNSNAAHSTKRTPKCLKSFEKIEDSGTNISYRCVDCRNCLECKNGSKIEEISIQEEVEQSLINKSIIVDIEKRICTAKLPFLVNPDTRLVPNLETARKVYNSQVRKLEKSPKDRNDVIESESKLQNLGYVDYLDNLTEDDQKMIKDCIVKYVIPWRVVWSKSISTPVRLVYDASQCTPGGCSLNEILAKGTNNMNNLVQILIRWSIRLWAFHTDIRKMYNAVQLDSSHWRFQLYLWQEELSATEEPRIKVIKTLIYGVKSSGNQAERAVRLTAENSIKDYPKAYNIIQNDIYVDDCISGTHSEEECMSVTDEIKLSLEKGGFTLKGFSFSGRDPDDKLSTDKELVSVGGLKWYPKEDYLMINVNELNFARKIRGRKCENGKGIPESLTMRDCVGKVAEMFDPFGRITPIIAGMKLDISLLHRSGLTWDDEIPDNMRDIWVSNFEMMQEIGRIKYRRAIVPVDAKNLDIKTIDTGDASLNLICVAIYARFERKDGSFSCQLVFARSKVVPVGTTIPRSETAAATMNAATGHTVKKAFGDYHKGALKLTDSMVTLHWINSKRTVLKTWVRNRVIEINRLCDTSCWKYVESSNMIADLGTRKGAKITDIIEGSNWINGLSWMNKSEDDFPVFSIEQIKLSKADIEAAGKEKVLIDPNQSMSGSFYSYNKEVEINSRVDNEIRKRYKFSNYLVNPNRFRLRKVIRVLGLVILFIKKAAKNIDRIQNIKLFHYECPGGLPKILESNGDKYVVTTGCLKDMGTNICAGGKVIEVSNDVLESAMAYFSTKTSLEVKKFISKGKYVNVTKEIDGILYYVGRIPEDYSFDGYPELCGAAIDLCRTTFCVPVMDQYSPVAISIALEVHWHHPDVKHSGIESMLRQMQRVAHIIGGRDLTKLIKRGCKKCRILNKASIDVLMGPIQNVNLCIAPAFYASQIDIFGPFKSYSLANKRATVKVWFLILCCCTTGGIDIRVMEDYSTDSFIQSFVRFSCRFGYPKYVLPDAGSQLVKGCEDMAYSFTDSKQKLSIEYGVQYIVCPVGSHYVHGKVERKIREVKKSVKVNIQNERLSVIQWETLMQQISNSINNLPIGLKNKVAALENLDIITPNRLILGRNNERCPNAPLIISGDHKKLIESNANIFRAWFKAWIISYVPSLVERPKWHKSDKHVNIGDIVLILKSEKEFDEQYQYGVVSSVHKSKDGHIRRVDIEYKNHHENVKRTTQRGVRDIIIVHPVDELDIYERLDQIIA